MKRRHGVKIYHNQIAKTPFSKMDEQIEERIEKEFTDKYLMYHRLETAHAFWNEKPKKKYQFWKKDEAIEESIRKKVAQRLKNLKSNR